VIAVAPRLFVAYDADTCRFHSAWSGEVEFHGDIAASSAGPTPKRKGAVQSEGGDGIPWETCDRGVFTPCRVRYRGCTFDDDFATLRFELLIDGESHPVLVEETPAILTPAEMDQLWRDWTNDPSGKWRDESGKLRVLRRTFRVHDLPSGTELSLRYQRTVKSVTGWTGFDGQRDLRAAEFETANCLLVEPLVLTFASTTEAQTFELIELQ
jgi:hypothetical protein